MRLASESRPPCSAFQRAKDSATAMKEPLVIPQKHGLYCPKGDFYIDPLRPVPFALITHAHTDHARAGHGAVLATRETLAIMAIRHGADFCARAQEIAFGELITLKDVRVTFYPAGHVLGSAQILVDDGATRLVFSGDYKLAPDPTSTPFEPIACDVFVSEATFGLPVFAHPPASSEIIRLFASLHQFPQRTHLVGVYALGKAQRLLALIHAHDPQRVVYLHGALEKITAYYRDAGIALAPTLKVSEVGKDALKGAIVLAPPSALRARWAQRFEDPLHVMASGWMQIRARARQSGIELPLVVSDHADWHGLCAAIRATGASTLWVTHGQEEALLHFAAQEGLEGRALRLIGYGEGDEEAGEGVVAPEEKNGAQPILS